jgi:hypothetical protein
VRDLIYAGRLPSLRIGRLHYVRATDLELERRRRLGLPLPRRRTAGSRLRRSPRAVGPRPHAEQHPHPHVDLAARRERAAERAALVSRWAQRHQAAEPQVPFAVVPVDQPVTCASCGHEVRQGRVVQAREGTPSELCLPCGRRAILDWADRRRIESAAARRLAHELRAVPAASTTEGTEPVQPADASPNAPSPRAA